MPNVHLTKAMEDYVEAQLRSGAYANVSEVLRAGLRKLMEEDGARDFYALKASLAEARRQALEGETAELDLDTFLASRREPRT